MAKLIFKYGETDGIREATSIELEIPDDINVKEFKNICIRLAQSLGYAQQSITNSFGEIERTESFFGPSVDGNINHEDIYVEFPEYDPNDPNNYQTDFGLSSLNELLREMNIRKSDDG